MIDLEYISLYDVLVNGLQWKLRGGGVVDGSIIIEIKGYKQGDPLTYCFHCLVITRALDLIETIINGYSEKKA